MPSLNLPKMDFDDVTRAASVRGFQAGYNISYAGHNWAGASNVCNYIEGGSMSVAWTGDVSPCWPLMHTHISYLHGKPRVNHRHVVGNVLDREPARPLAGSRITWPTASASRILPLRPAPSAVGASWPRRTRRIASAMIAPVCGGCLWAQGVIQCP